MKIDCGIIGLPNVGKSTLFNVLTDMSVKVANFPFCTIHSNSAIVHIPDPRIYQIANIARSRQVMHDTIQFVDTAGLIVGAAHGIGLGDQIFDNVRLVKVLCHMVRCFDSDQITHVIDKGDIDPIRDVNIVHTELILSDMLYCERNIAVLERKNRVVIDDGGVCEELFVLKRCLRHLCDGVLLRDVSFSKSEWISIQKFNFLTLKPMIYIANVDLTCNNNVYLSKLRKFIVCQKKTPVIPCCCIDLLAKNAFSKCSVRGVSKNFCLRDINLECDNFFLYDLVCSIFSILNLNTFFTANLKMTHAWSNIIGTTAVIASDRVHSDFSKGFISAQIIKFDDFIYHKGELGAKKAGKVRSVGKSYCIEDGDIIKFIHSHRRTTIRPQLP